MSGEEPERPELLILLPSLRMSGGNKEIVRLGAAVAERGVRVRLLVLWKHAYECPHGGLPVEYLSDFAPIKRKAFAQFGTLLSRFRHYMRAQTGPVALMLTHFSTFPFGWLLPRGSMRLCFNQDMEWMFVPTLLRFPARSFILLTSRRSFMVTSNGWVSRQYARYGITRDAEASTWAEPFWAGVDAPVGRSVDVVLLLRLGPVKRLDMHLQFLDAIQAAGDMRCGVITPEREIAALVGDRASHVLLQPSDGEMKQLYAQSRLFVLLSEVEGFGLPPLEAMGSGCVPLCRDSGGVQNYLDGPLRGNLIPLDESVGQIVHRVRALLADPARLAVLSETARAVFQEGLLRADAERENCFDRIARKLARHSRGDHAGHVDRHS